MNNNSVKIAVCILVCVLIAAIELGLRANAQTQTELTPQQARGKRIYEKGDDESGKVMAMMGDLAVPATVLPCADCHGLSGEGRTEGEVTAPRMSWEALTKPGAVPTGRSHKAYDEQTLARSIEKGVDPDSNPLQISMPRYKYTAAQMADLIAYLKTLSGKR